MGRMEKDCEPTASCRCNLDDERTETRLKILLNYKTSKHTIFTRHHRKRKFKLCTNIWLKFNAVFLFAAVPQECPHPCPKCPYDQYKHTQLDGRAYCLDECFPNFHTITSREEGNSCVSEYFVITFFTDQPASLTEHALKTIDTGSIPCVCTQQRGQGGGLWPADQNAE